MKARVLIIDNYDSFTFNVMQQIGSLDHDVFVYRNDVSVHEILECKPSHLILSPGPGNPSDTGNSRELVEHFQGRIPILGVCLGHQLLGEMFGAKLVRAPIPIHGESHKIEHDGKTLFRGLSSPTEMARYHSLVLSEKNWPQDLEITAWTSQRIIMGLRHRSIPKLEGVQFHPESFMSHEGTALMRNFLHGIP